MLCHISKGCDASQLSQKGFVQSVIEMPFRPTTDVALAAVLLASPTSGPVKNTNLIVTMTKIVFYLP
jgi:hypothetical protein